MPLLTCSGSCMPLWNDNLTSARASFVTRLECAMTGATYAPDEVRNLSDAGWPLLIRYDLDGARQALTRETLAARPADLWRWREILPVRRAQSIVGLGESETPLVPLARVAARLGLRALLVKDEG